MTPSSPSSDPTGPGPVTVYLVDDHAVFRSGVRAELADEPGLRVVGEAGTVPEAIDGIVAAAPDVVLLDLEMPVMDGMTALPLLLRAEPRPEVIESTARTAPSVPWLPCMYSPNGRP